MSELKVIVIGGVNQGKSAVAQLVNQALSNAGFDVTNSDDDELSYRDADDIQKLRIDNTLLKNTSIEILTQQIYRESSKE